jgi:hypothetical protein
MGIKFGCNSVEVYKEEKRPDDFALLNPDLRWYGERITALEEQVKHILELVESVQQQVWR